MTVSETTFTIRDLATEFDLTTRTIRFYEDRGLLTPERSGQKRIYHKGDRARLKLILRGKRLGFTLDEIQQLVTAYESPDDEIPQLEQYLKTLVAHRKTLLQQKADLERTLLDLEKAEADCRMALARKG
ncbi:MAG: MerR family DNA-binding transcriptional regulator [Saccharospirillum sp.]|nr:MerR family DNA-binding transcriptional regulator [Saccharospirillum sp.]